MKLNIYLHRNIIDLMKRFGDDLGEVADRIIEDMQRNGDEYIDLPDGPPREGAVRTVIDVTNREFLEMMEILGKNSGRVSIRKVIYWFFDNEKYAEYGWKYNYIGKDKKLKLMCAYDLFERRLNECVGTEKLAKFTPLLTELDKMIGEIDD